MADGYARVSGRAQAVVVHVDVGTQALGQGLHNASVGRAPVFIFAGMCPYTEAGEMTGSRTEYMHWLQEAPDQKAIVRQYCRYTGEIRTGLNVKQTVARALQFANSGPKGPVYVASGRETLAEVIEEPYQLDQEQWKAPSFLEREKVLADSHKQKLVEIAARCHLGDEQSLDASNIGHLLKQILPDTTVFVIEAVTCGQLLSDQIQADRPGSWINCGATGIGWSNGAALGVKMATDDAAVTMESAHKPTLICQVVGDGSFMCAAPSSALWVASKYKIPILTIVLNNGGRSAIEQLAICALTFLPGFKAPKNSTALVYPDGLNQGATDDEMNISFRPSPNYAALAEAATGSQSSNVSTQDSNHWMEGVRVDSVASLRKELGKVSQRVLEAKKGMLIEALIA
ncbi:hypothetical protein J4E83_005667 [Alternaria metachromatica]|uniref:uncharacterized protein n=1 Tax=Alternaria metachromatica TaxID=283354 RepID=UPI0020C3C511|nr:uncharacterized protein J4E83_005667 [Alternaria metachromatica]KAI4619811.1 hypothetical protein J4E83_005667 [Alternaria metachromatica]